MNTQVWILVQVHCSHVFWQWRLAVHGAMCCSQKSFKLVWRCHQFLSGFLANENSFIYYFRSILFHFILFSFIISRFWRPYCQLAVSPWNCVSSWINRARKHSYDIFDRGLSYEYAASLTSLPATLRDEKRMILADFAFCYIIFYCINFRKEYRIAKSIQRKRTKCRDLSRSVHCINMFKICVNSNMNFMDILLIKTNDISNPFA